MDPIDPTTREGMKVLTLRAVELCRLRLTMSGGFEQRCGLYVGSTTEEFTLSTRAAASSLSRILQEAQKEAQRAHAEVLCLMLRRSIVSLNRHGGREQWDSIFVITQTPRRTAIAMLPFRATDLGLVFEELQTGECETESCGAPEVIFRKFGYVVDAAVLDDTPKGRGSESTWN
jgi:hypothetical protein